MCIQCKCIHWVRKRRGRIRIIIKTVEPFFGVISFPVFCKISHLRRFFWSSLVVTFTHCLCDARISYGGAEEGKEPKISGQHREREREKGIENLRITQREGEGNV